ncbi:hypothetical protein HPB50_020891 [Hyalomma asiaticum]|uniref:Uncharacterized protein n=1 Tax=Hyalomma asiaticum TaxID=266040 RepID=A0ACB7TB59_HYAAI|nr:hypothetical protein HPB50_020891 [Hyalomma asiaticum]
MAPILFVLVLLVPATLAAVPTGNCINATLPGILNLGQTALVTALTKLLTCLITPLTGTNFTGALTAFFDVITIVLRTIGFGSFLTFVQSALTPLCALGGTNVVPGCTTLLSGNQTCSAPISITLPDMFNISRCVNQTALLCQNGTLASDQLLLNVIDTITLRVAMASDCCLIISDCCSIAPDCALIVSANRSRISASDPFASVAAGVDADTGVSLSSISSIAASVDSWGGALRFACPSTGFGANVDDVLP